MTHFTAVNRDSRDAYDLLRAGVLGFDVPHQTVDVSWPLSDGSSLGKIKIETGAKWRGRGTIFVYSQAFSDGGKQLIRDGQTIRVTVTRPHFGGERLWFVCGCGRRSGRLYLPTGEMVFRCRLCYDLTYQSSQEHNTERAKMRATLEMFRQYQGGGMRKPGQSRRSIANLR